MEIWWSGMTNFQQVLFVIGCAMALLLIIQIIMMLIGIGDDPSFDFDTSLDGDPFNHGEFVGLFGLKIFTIRSAITFIAIGSWVCFTLLYSSIPTAVCVILACLAGAVAAVLMAYALKQIEGLSESGNVNIANAVGKTCDVYLVIPAAKSGAGKVQIVVDSRTREYDAYTTNEEKIPTGAKVRVSEIIDETTLMVEVL